MTYRGALRGLGLGTVARFSGDATNRGVSVPDAPTIGLATAGNTETSVAFTPAVGGAPATSYTVTSSPGGLTASGGASPLVVTGLTNGVAYTFTVKANNAGGSSAASSATGATVPLFLWGVFPLWHHGATTPDADGAISAIADMSLGLYPLSQGTGAAQPDRGSGKITFDTDEFVESSDATLAGFATGASFAALIVADLNGSTPSTSETILSWTSTVSGTRKSYMRHNVADKMLSFQQHGGTSVTATSTANMDATRKTYISNHTGGASSVTTQYVSNILDGTSATADTGSTAGNRFGLGAETVTPSFFFNGSIIAACAMSREATAGERAEWEAYLTAGCPERSA